MTRGRGGLTIAELLITIAILGALCAMVIPAFSRARESARFALCLSNVRSLAQAVRMYAMENDSTLPPRYPDAAAINYFAYHPGKGGSDQWDPLRPGAEPMCHRARQADPHLRWPVILDPYLPSRDVWRCPSARLEGGASFINGHADWLEHLRTHEREWGIIPTRGSVRCRVGPRAGEAKSLIRSPRDGWPWA